MDHYDLISLGSGEAGKYIAWTYAAAQGKKCAVIEKSMLGGSCPNVACLPSKNVIYSAKVAHLASHGDHYGLAQTNAGAKLEAVKKRKDLMIDGLMDMHKANFEAKKVELIWGEGRFVGPSKLEINGESGKRTLTADKVIVCTGSRANVPDIPGLAKAEPLTHVELLSLDELPRHLIILGAGYVGLEFAQALCRLGSAVTVIDRHDHILQKEDEDVASLLQEVLESEGVKFLLGTTVEHVAGPKGSVNITGKRGGKSVSVHGSHVLAATGRFPNTDDIGIEEAGLQVDEKGHIVVDEFNRASKDGTVFAVGDCAGSPYFTHIGYDDFRIVRDVLAGHPIASHRRSGRQVPFTLFTDPEFAHIGLREHEAKAKGIKYRLAKVPMGAFLRTRTLGEGSMKGFAKALVAADSDLILGFSAVGPHAGELLPVVQLAMKKQLPFMDIAELVITHPTMNEGLASLFGSLL